MSVISTLSWRTSRCTLPHGIQSKTMIAMDNLYSLTLVNTQINDWNLASSILPLNTFALYLENIPLERLSVAPMLPTFSTCFFVMYR
ncbi:hypothetical protein THRCLA_02535 [Thraustotheca clavata]|uniref:Uncharacterized protein n=1 Tax=Thraustotheca clavata TaxID=74557 RepID=A0A1W0A4U2_9STRA|nr:hypothetical protein THRCLA_02535 [Thraustotheca clavata]